MDGLNRKWTTSSQNRQKDSSRMLCNWGYWNNWCRMHTPAL